MAVRGTQRIKQLSIRTDEVEQVAAKLQALKLGTNDVFVHTAAPSDPQEHQRLEPSTIKTNVHGGRRSSSVRPRQHPRNNDAEHLTVPLRKRVVQNGRSRGDMEWNDKLLVGADRFSGEIDTQYFHRLNQKVQRKLGQRTFAQIATTLLRDAVLVTCVVTMLVLAHRWGVQ